MFKGELLHKEYFTGPFFLIYSDDKTVFKFSGTYTANAGKCEVTTTNTLQHWVTGLYHLWLSWEWKWNLVALEGTFPQSHYSLNTHEQHKQTPRKEIAAAWPFVFNPWDYSSVGTHCAANAQEVSFFFFTLLMRHLLYSNMELWIIPPSILLPEWLIHRIIKQLKIKTPVCCCVLCVNVYGATNFWCFVSVTVSIHLDKPLLGSRWKNSRLTFYWKWCMWCLSVLCNSSFRLLIQLIRSI